MDFLDPRKKRAHHIRLFIGYGLMAVALLMATGILVVIANGYYYDRRTRTIIQNGTVFVDSHPVKGMIYLNGKEERSADARLDLPAANYDMELRRDGYRTWRRGFELVGGTIERFVYPFLWPQKLSPTAGPVFDSAPLFAAQSPDRRWVVMQQPGQNLNVFSVTDLNRRPINFASTPLTLPADVLTPGPGINQLTLVEWSTDNRHILVKHSFQNGANFIIIDREEPANSININKTLPTTAFTAVRLRDKRFDRLYLHNTADGGLATADIRTRTVAPYISKVLAFQPHGDDVVLYATADAAPQGKALVRIRQGQTTYDIRELTAAPAYLLDIARFENRWYMAAGSTGDPRVYVYRDMFDRLKEAPQVQPQPLSTLRVDNPEYLSFSANTRFIGVQGGSRFAVYDAEMERSHRFDIPVQLSPGQKAAWMDGHRYVAVSGGQLIVFEFDGNNFQTLVPNNPGQLPFFDRDYTVLFTLAPGNPDQTKTGLFATQLRIPADQ